LNITEVIARSKQIEQKMVTNTATELILDF
jgi:hypothetical protein